MNSSTGERAARYRDLFADREFSALFCADVLSKTAGQLGRLALIFLVWDRTDSPALAAASVAVLYLPGLTGGPLLATLADRWPRRRLMLTCDLSRGPLVAGIAIVTAAELPFSIPLALLILLFVGLLDAPFGAARQAMLADILPDRDLFTLGNSVVAASQQFVTVIGFGVGGAVVALVGSYQSLFIHAGAYLVSASIVVLFVRARPAPANDDGHPHLVRDALAGLRVVMETPRLPPLFWLLLVGPGVMITAEAIAVPLATELELPSTARGLLIAALPLGSAIGLTGVGKLTTTWRERLLLPLSLCVGVAIALSGLFQPAYAVGAFFVLAGIGMGHLAHLQSTIVSLVEPKVRGRVIGFAQMMLQVAQCVGALLAGVVAQATSFRVVLFGAGAVGVLLVLVGTMLRSPLGGKHRASPRQLRRERRDADRANGDGPDGTSAPPHAGQPGPEAPSYDVAAPQRPPAVPAADAQPPHAPPPHVRLPDVQPPVQAPVRPAEPAYAASYSTDDAGYGAGRTDHANQTDHASQGDPDPLPGHAAWRLPNGHHLYVAAEGPGLPPTDDPRRPLVDEDEPLPWSPGPTDLEATHQLTPIRDEDPSVVRLRRLS